MTIGIGGWGSRRKPMSLVRAIVRSGVQDLTVVAYMAQVFAAVDWVTWLAVMVALPAASSCVVIS